MTHLDARISRAGSVSPYVYEQLEILRRIAERGLSLAQRGDNDGFRYVDLFQHLLDEIKRTKESE